MREDKWLYAKVLAPCIETNGNVLLEIDDICFISSDHNGTLVTVMMLNGKLINGWYRWRFAVQSPLEMLADIAEPADD